MDIKEFSEELVEMLKGNMTVDEAGKAMGPEELYADMVDGSQFVIEIKRINEDK